MRTPAIVALMLMISVAAFAQPAIYDSFSTSEINSRWTVDAHAESSCTVDTERGVLALKGPTNTFMHLETPLPDGATYIQADFNSINDASASWAPGIIIYWDEANWVRLLVSTFYDLRVDARADGEIFSGTCSKVPIDTGTWYRAAVRIENSRIALLFAEVGSELAEVGQVPMAPSFSGTPTVIIGKGFQPDTPGAPDFDNPYSTKGPTTRAEIDDIVIGDPATVTNQLTASANQRVATLAHDPSGMEVAFWPNITNPDTQDTLWFAPGAYQRLSLLYTNRDELLQPEDWRVELSLPSGIDLQEVTLGEFNVDVTCTPTDLGTDVIIRPVDYKVAAALGGTDRDDPEKPGWFSWPVSAKIPVLAVHVVASPQADGSHIRARAVATSGAGPWREMNVSITPPLPELAQGPPEHLGISLWDGPIAHDGPGEDAVIDKMLAQYSRLGVTRFHTSRYNRDIVIAAARRHNISPFVTSWWHYSTQCPPEFKPTDDERATNASVNSSGFCPEIIGAGSGTYGTFLQTVTDKMAETGADGFMLDYECAMPLCYCDRCKAAFIAYSGLKDVNWPADVKEDARYYDQWISFRSWQGAQYVRVIRDAARKANPEARMQAWIAGYDYAGTIRSATIDVSKASKFMTEPEIPHYTLPADYSDMWTKDVDKGSVEMGIQTFQDSLDHCETPLIFCSSIIYPIGGKTVWSDPQILDAQIQAIFAQGGRGLSFWGGHDWGATDGRYMHKLIKWNNLLAEAGRYLWNGSRDDSLATVSDPDDNLLRRYVWTDGDRALIALVNLDNKDRQCTASVNGFGTRGHRLLSHQSADLADPITVPALDGVWIELRK